MTNTTDPDEARRQATAALWSQGDYVSVGAHFTAVGEGLVDTAGVRRGQRVLDVACGPGVAALEAARRGADVTGVDLTESLLDVAREAAAAEGLPVRLDVGDAAALPYADASFDVTVSSLGVMFAPDPAAAAAELARVTRPGGRVAVASWAHTGTMTAMSLILADYAGDTARRDAPLAWRDPDTAQTLLRPHVASVEARVRHHRFSFDSVEEMLTLFERASAPWLAAKAAIEPTGRWPQARAAIGERLAASVLDGTGCSWDEPYVEVLAAR